MGKKELKGLIKEIIRIPGLKRYVQGDGFCKGEYMTEDAPTYWVRVSGEKSFEVERDRLLSFSPNRQRITDAFLDTFKGQDSKTLR